MRSVVVVLPASMWAMMPMFRVRARGVLRGMRVDRGPLPAIVGEGLVGVGHAVDVFALLDGAAAVVGGVEDFVGQLLDHALLAAGAGVEDEPADGEGDAAGGVDLDGHLVVGAADAAGLDLD